jgi:preprotein translocase subunit SecF
LLYIPLFSSSSFFILFIWLDIEEVVRREFGVSQVSSQRREVGASLGKAFVESSFWIVFWSCLAILLVIFVFFREFVPSLAIIAEAITDIAFALAIMSFLKIPLSLSSIASLLMLLGYSIDKDILLTTSVLKRKEGSARDRAFSSMTTGLTMTSTALAALFVMLLFSYFYQIQTIFEIALILIAGLIADIPATWLFNAPLILWYVESKGVVK